MFIAIAISLGHSVKLDPSILSLRELIAPLEEPLPPRYADFEASKVAGVIGRLKDLIQSIINAPPRPRQPRSKPANKLSVHHLPHHDIESLFWSFVWTVGRSQADGDETKVLRAKSREEVHQLLQNAGSALNRP